MEPTKYIYLSIVFHYNFEVLSPHHILYFFLRYTYLITLVIL